MSDISVGQSYKAYLLMIKIEDDCQLISSQVIILEKSLVRRGSNKLLDFYGYVALTEFGIAKFSLYDSHTHIYLKNVP